MGLNDIYTRKYLDRVDLLEPLSEQQFIGGEDLKDLLPDTIEYDDKFYYLKIDFSSYGIVSIKYRNFNETKFSFSHYKSHSLSILKWFYHQFFKQNIIIRPNVLSLPANSIQQCNSQGICVNYIG